MHPLVIVGAGPVGLTLAIDVAERLAPHGVDVLLLDGNQRPSTGSRAICFAKRTLEIWDRIGVGSRMVDKGVSWSIGRVFLGAAPLYAFDLLPEPGHERPAFINLQQFHAEAYLAERAATLPNLRLLRHHRVAAIDGAVDHVALTVSTPDGPTLVRAQHVAACDGSRSTLRALLGLQTQGRVFQDRFLIADVAIDGELFPEGRAERWFWFDPPFHRAAEAADAADAAGSSSGNVAGTSSSPPPAPSSVLLHRQPDGQWRIDFQLGWHADPEAEKQPGRIVPRVQALLRQGFGRDVPFTLVWASVYTFACQRMQRFRHGRVLFAGDAAHGVSPFGARGANSGVQDADNLGWKLAAVLRGVAPDALLDSYGSEREAAADENLLHSSRATDFITPKTEISRLFRDAVLQLAGRHAFARELVNSGRLSVPAVLDGSPLSTPDGVQAAAACEDDADDDLAPPFGAALRPGAPAVDAPLRRAGRRVWLLRELVAAGAAAAPAAATAPSALADVGGVAVRPVASAAVAPGAAPTAAAGFTLLVFGSAPVWAAAAGQHGADLAVLAIDGDTVVDDTGLAAARWGALPGSAWLLRPDGHVAARWRKPVAAQVRAALDRALARPPAVASPDRPASAPAVKPAIAPAPAPAVAPPVG